MTYRPYPNPDRARHQIERHQRPQTVTIAPALEPLAQAFRKIREVAEERRARGEADPLAPRLDIKVSAGAGDRLAAALRAFGEAVTAPLPRGPERPVGSEEKTP